MPCSTAEVHVFDAVQADFGRVPLPIADYITDTRSTLDNSLRLLQAMIDVCADQGWLHTTLALISMIQVRQFATIAQSLGDERHRDCPYLTSHMLASEMHAGFAR
jgi:Sec63 Brl domain